MKVEVCLTVDEARDLFAGLRLFECVRGDEANELIAHATRVAVDRIDAAIRPLRKAAKKGGG